MEEFNTEDRNKDFLVKKGSSKLTVAFAGLPGGLCEVRHDFYNATSGLDCSKIYVKDPEAIWYQHGINSEINTIAALHNKLQKTILDLNPTEITCIGISAGGYAAILFGALLKVNRVEAFGPQTFLDPRIAEDYSIASWLDTQLKRMYDVITDRTYWDLRNFIDLSYNTKQIIHVCNQHKEDLIHANWISHFPNVIIKEYDCAEHAPASYLKRFNLLVNVLENKQ